MEYVREYEENLFYICVGRCTIRHFEINIMLPTSNFVNILERAKKAIPILIMRTVRSDWIPEMVEYPGDTTLVLQLSNFCLSLFEPML